MAATLFVCLLALFCVGAIALAIRLVLGKPALENESENDRQWWRAIK